MWGCLAFVCFGRVCYRLFASVCEEREIFGLGADVFLIWNCGASTLYLLMFNKILLTESIKGHFSIEQRKNFQISDKDRDNRSSKLPSKSLHPQTISFVQSYLLLFPR